jgi:Phage minor structural protein GP20
MSDDNQNVEPIEVPDGAPEAVPTPEPKFKTIEEALAAYADLESRSIKDAETLKKVRGFEKQQKANADALLKEQGKWKEVAEAAEKKLAAYETEKRQAGYSDILKGELAKSGAKAVNSAFKLIDKDTLVFDEDGNVDKRSMAKAIRDLQKSDADLFTEVDSSDEEPVKPVPSVKRVVEGAKVSGYESELAEAVAARDQKKLNAVLKKYGHL